MRWGLLTQVRDGSGRELIDKYIEAEARRKEWVESKGRDFTPNVDPKRLPLLSYDTVADICGQTAQPEDKHDAFVTFMGTSDGPCFFFEGHMAAPPAEGGGRGLVGGRRYEDG